MLKPGDIAFAKVRGHSPWPAKILNRVSSRRLKVFFFGTNEEGVVKETEVWDYGENLERFSSRYGSRQLYATALEQVKMNLKRQAKKKTEEAYETKQLVFAKMKGYSPWPAQILGKTGSKMYDVFFFGTSQTGKVKKENIWNYDTTCEKFTAKYGKRKSYALALKQIGEISSLTSPKSTKEKTSNKENTSSKKKTANNSQTVAVFVDEETIPSISNLKVAEDNDVAMVMDDEVNDLLQPKSNWRIIDDKEIEKPIPMFEDDQVDFDESSNSERDMGSNRGILQGRPQYDAMPELSQKRNNNIKKDSKIEQNTQKEKLNSADVMCTEELKPQDVLKRVEEPNKFDKRNFLANNRVFSKVPRSMQQADFNVDIDESTTNGLTRHMNSTSGYKKSSDSVPKEKLEECENDDPVVVFDSRMRDIPIGKIDKDKNDSSVAVFQNRPNNVNKIEDNIEHVIEEIPRNDLVIKISGFSITRTIRTKTCHCRKLN